MTDIDGARATPAGSLVICRWSRRGPANGSGVIFIWRPHKEDADKYDQN